MPTITIHGLSLDVPEPYSEGHVLTTDEARALNGLYVDRVRNNFSRKVKSALPECGWNEAPGLATSLRSEFAQYVSTYRFDTAEQALLTREALTLARSLVMARLNRAGTRVEDLSRDELDNLIGLCAQSPEVLTEANRRLGALREAAEVMLPGELALS